MFYWSDCWCGYASNNRMNRVYKRYSESVDFVCGYSADTKTFPATHHSGAFNTGNRTSSSGRLLMAVYGVGVSGGVAEKLEYCLPCVNCGYYNKRTRASKRSHFNHTVDLTRLFDSNTAWECPNCRLVWWTKRDIGRAGWCRWILPPRNVR